jgi:gentisate 1,2-dioxygenase
MATDAGPGGKMEDLDLFYEQVKQVHGRGLWQTEGTAKKAATLPYIWKYQDFRPLLLKAAEMVPIEMAERRVLVMANPGILTDWQASSTMLANLQIILSGEVARSHRHSASALRLVIEGNGAYTAVDGEKSYMDPGDFVTTPNWTWHDHGNESDGAMIWLDGLDVPFTQATESMFYEVYSEEKYPVVNPDDMSIKMYGGGALRPTWVKHNQYYSPLLNYKFESTYATLKSMARETDGSPFDGISVEYTNPMTGGPALATMSCFASLLPKGRHTRAHRHTGGTIYHVIKGKGRSVINGKVFRWDEKDTFVVPSWAWHEHHSESEAVLFSYSDSAVLGPLGLYREEELAENDGHQKIEGNFEALPVPERAGGVQQRREPPKRC